MTTTSDDPLAAATLLSYSPAEFPCLWDFIDSDDRPLAGQRVLCGFPIFRNTLPLYWALRAAGAHVVATVAPGIPGDSDVVADLPGIGIPVATVPDGSEYDIVLDCAGALSQVPARIGFVELTKSGEAIHRDNPLPVFLADAGAIKQIETSLGTGDGFIRGLGHFGYTDLTNRSIVLFGCGKVGRGIAERADAEGATVTVIDTRATPGSDQFLRISTQDTAAIHQAIASAWCIVSATGVEGALQPWAPHLCGSPALLANMGAHDEFGSSVPTDRVLNRKEPLNFVLAEPTRLRYIDPTLALAVAGAAELAAGHLTAGINLPGAAVEHQVLAPALRHGRIADELAAAGL